MKNELFHQFKLNFKRLQITKFRLRFINHNFRMGKQELLGRAEKVANELLYPHFCTGGHSGLSDVRIQLIDQVNGDEQLREKKGEWAYKLKTLVPNGLNDNDFFFVQNRRSRHTQEPMSRSIQLHYISVTAFS